MRFLSYVQVHDYFVILGIAPGASRDLIQRASARRIAGVHPDFRPVQDRPCSHGVPARDAAVHFIEMSDLIDSMEAAFFTSGER